MVKKFGIKREKFQVTKWWAADEWRPVWEMEWVMDVELFLEGQAQWEEDSPHHLAIMHEMFQYAAAKGQKEAEWIVHWGCQQKSPQLNPEAGIPAIWLVGLETSKEDLQELYLEVYKLHRLPGSPPGEPALLEEVLSSLEDHQWQEGEKASAATVRLHLEDPYPSRGGAPHKGKRDSSAERSLATIHEAHQKVLAMAATLEEEIESLSHTQNCPEVRVRSKSRECQGCSREEQKRRHCQVQSRTPLSPTTPLARGQSLVRKQLLPKVQIWRSHQS